MVSADLHRQPVHSKRTSPLDLSCPQTFVASLTVAVDVPISALKAAVASVESVTVQVAAGAVNTAASDLSVLLSEAVTGVKSLTTVALSSEATDALANDVTSLISGLETTIGNIGQDATNAGLGGLIIPLATIINGPLSEILAGLDAVVVGLLSLVGNLLSGLGLGSILGGLGL